MPCVRVHRPSAPRTPSVPGSGLGPSSGCRWACSACRKSSRYGAPVCVIAWPPGFRSANRCNSAHAGPIPGASAPDQSQTTGPSRTAGRARSASSTAAIAASDQFPRSCRRQPKPHRSSASCVMGRWLSDSSAICYQEEMHTDPLLQILILLAASICVVAGVRKLALPAILGYLVVGMLLGPRALAVAVDNETTQLLADFGVVFLVFTLGLEFSLPRLVAMRWEVLGVGGAQVLITTGIIAAGSALLFGVPPAVAVVIGGAVAMSSTAIIISQLTEQSENNRTHGRLAVAICLFQ